MHRLVTAESSRFALRPLQNVRRRIRILGAQLREGQAGVLGTFEVGERQAQLEEIVRHSGHGRDHSNDRMALALGCQNAPGDIRDALGRADGGAAIFLNNQCQSREMDVI